MDVGRDVNQGLRWNAEAFTRLLQCRCHGPWDCNDRWAWGAKSCKGL
jgi:hypothetical protein